MTSRYERHHNPQPSKPKQTVAQILQSASETLKMAEFGLADISGDDPSRRIPGLRNVAVWGRSVTNVLQKLRTPVGDAFDEWYGAEVKAMEDDELIKYLYDLRSEILKEGSTPATTSAVRIGFMGPTEMGRLQRNAPPNATGFFIGDNLGGSGWIVRLPDGSEDRYYVALPDDFDVEVRMHFADPPVSKPADRMPSADTSVEALARRYVEHLRKLVDGAKEQFGT